MIWIYSILGWAAVDAFMLLGWYLLKKDQYL